MNEKVLSEVPECIKKNLIYCDKIFYSRKNYYLLGITKNREVIEIKDFSILSICELTEEEELFEDDSQDFLIPNDPKNSSYKITPFFHVNNEERQTFFLVSRESKLFVIKRANQKLLLHAQYKNVEKFEFIEGSSGNSIVQISYHGQSTRSNISFASNEFQPEPESVGNCEIVSNVLKDLKIKTKKVESKIRQLEIDTKKSLKSLEERLKFVPITMRSDSIEEKFPLIRYGDIWTRTHNGRLVIGVPLFNCTHER
jgi:hypothetical protein